MNEADSLANPTRNAERTTRNALELDGVTRSFGGLQAGLQRTKSIDFSYPQGANDFTGNRVTTGGQFWRVVQFMPSCKCWQVVQRDFKRGF